MPVLMGSSPGYETRSGGVVFLVRFGWGLSVGVDFRFQLWVCLLPDMRRQGPPGHRVRFNLVRFPYNGWIHPVTARPRGGLSEVETRLALGQDNRLRSSLLLFMF